ncbi:hypothetical protein CLG94_07640 [Candidatus Methylomirabilis limnetica]|uniref:Uncharacterized protein n=1 Tax=Candidatus Methylomirabilis limnetica TaxID=2033718 RepID=A0A2T4TX07_9BACT|nr:hypothetical protein [Candidatus Methylomirabilis limnetica]PTL35635.1 hypothetical protein CLG94_07640 [Candidatus Methylomirabilis limnetica]
MISARLLQPPALLRCAVSGVRFGAAPEHGVPTRYAGKQTVLGHLIGRVVGEATTQSVKTWTRTRGVGR